MRVAMLLVPSVVCVATTDCHAGELLKSIKNEQNKLPKVAKDHVMHNVFKHYDNLNTGVKETLDILWHNAAGNLLLRRLNSVIKDDLQRITILWDVCDEDDDSNYFRYKDSSILLHKDKFGDYAVYSNKKIEAFPEQLDTVLFHELCHALHNLEDTIACNQHKIIPTFYKLSDKDPKCQEICRAWEDDEEIHTITGWYIDTNEKLKFDCLNTNSYMILDALKDKIKPEKIVQRVFHYDYWSASVFTEEDTTRHLDELVIPLEKYVDV